METNPKDKAGDRLNSWKEIARYLGKTVRTVQRWEQHSGLPVRRVNPDSGASVYAYTHELDRWLTRRNLAVHGPEHPKHAGRTESPGSAEQAASTTTPTPEPPAELPDPQVSVPRGSQSVPPLAWIIGTLALVAAGWWMTTGKRTDPVQAVPFDARFGNPRLLTTDKGEERFPALSPDGRQVAYVWTDPGGQTDIYLRVVEIHSPRQLTDDDATEESLAWAPDGLSLAYLRRSGPARRQLRVMSAEGTNDRLLHEFHVATSMDSARSMSASLAWAPDGTAIAFTEGQAGDDGQRLSLLHLADLRTSPLTELHPGVRDHHPAFSPDGRRLAFTRSPQAMIGGIYLLGLDPLESASAQPLALALQGVEEWNSDAEWTPDGRFLIFSSGLWPRSRLWTVPVDGSSAPQVLDHAEIGASQPSIAPLLAPGVNNPGWRLVYRRVELENDIWRIDTAGDEADERLIASSQRERFPAYAPDGRIAFLSDRTGHREIHERDAVSGKLRQWTEWRSNYIRQPNYSPDGSTLAYIVEADGQFAVHLQDQPLTPSRSLYRQGFQDISMAWSSDGERIYVLSRRLNETDLGVWALDLEGGEPRHVVKGEFAPLGEDPAGMRLFLISTEGGVQKLWSMALETGERVAVPLGDEPRHSFTLAGNGIWMVARYPEGYALDYWDWDNGVLRTVKNLDHEPEPGLAISPDGRHALLARIVQQRSDLMVVDPTAQVMESD